MQRDATQSFIEIKKSQMVGANVSFSSVESGKVLYHINHSRNQGYKRPQQSHHI